MLFKLFRYLCGNMTKTERKAYRILALDDHPMVLEGISHLLTDYSINTCTDTAQMMSLLEKGQQFDLFVLDLELPDSDGFDVLKRIRQHCPDCAILIYTMHGEPWVLARLAKLDIQGAVSKALPVSSLQRAVEAIRQGDSYFDETFIAVIQQSAIGQSVSQPYMASPAFQLSEREQQVLNGIAEGLTTPEISARLFISENTVGTYRRRLMTKFDAHNVAQLIQKARWYLNEQKEQ